MGQTRYELQVEHWRDMRTGGTLAIGEEYESQVDSWRLVRSMRNEWNISVWGGKFAVDGTFSVLGHLLNPTQTCICMISESIIHLALNNIKGKLNEQFYRNTT